MLYLVTINNNPIQAAPPATRARDMSYTYTIADPEQAISAESLFNMALHDIVQIHHYPYFRVMRVSGGWMYNYYDQHLDDYKNDWVFVPLNNEFLNK